MGKKGDFRFLSLHLYLLHFDIKLWMGWHTIRIISDHFLYDSIEMVFLLSILRIAKIFSSSSVNSIHLNWKSFNLSHHITNWQIVVSRQKHHLASGRDYGQSKPFSEAIKANLFSMRQNIKSISKRTIMDQLQTCWSFSYNFCSRNVATQCHSALIG